MKPLMFQQFVKGKSCRWFSLFTIGLLFFFAGSCQAVTVATTTPTGQSLDAVAIRILPNVEHYGIERWYVENGFSGSPQYLIVDGYEAIRDGRTVYVNATNIVGGKIYTNIYLISYNQDSKPGTTDALAQIIANWKFNNNLSATGQCAYTVTATSTCLVDADCLGVGFCNSLKSKVTRDVKRLAILAEIKDSLRKYKETNNKYPDLPTGSYLPHLTVSTWPSWQSTFAAQLGLDKSLVDPINKLGTCAGYDATTCWNKNLSTSAIKTNPVKLPDNSLVMAYQSQNSGNQYTLCSSMESAGTFNTQDGLLQASACSVNLGSTASSSGLAFEALNLQGELNSEFNGYVKITNLNGNPTTWDLAPKNISAFEGKLDLIDTNNPNQKKIYSKKAIAEGSFEVNISITDNRTGAVISTTTKISIGRDKPRVEAESTDFILNKNKLSYVFYINDSSIPSGDFPSYSLKLNGFAQQLPTIKNGNANTDTDTGLRLKIEQIERGRFKLTIFQSTPTITNISTNPETAFNFSVALRSGTNVANKDFTITLKQDKPIFDYQCEENVRKYDNYNCLIKVSNTDDHDITYTVSSLSGTNLNFTTTTKTATISGHVIANNVPAPPVISDGTCTTDKGSTLNNDLKKYSEVTKKLINTYKEIVGKGINFTTSTKRISTTTPTTTPPTDNKTYDKNTLPSSSFLSPITKTLAFIKASFLTGEALADKYIGKLGDTGGTCQTYDQVYANYYNSLRALDETFSTTTPQSVFKIDITAKNEYGASAASTFYLKVNTYCGDGVKQAPNQEKRGGLYNDGVEECDGVAGVAVNAADSSVNRQYSCTTGINHAAIPNPITSNDFCRTTGGYCGDGICGEDDTYSTDNSFEKYDPGDNTDQYCHADCAYCGDGIVQTNKGELCDPGDPFSIQSSLGEVCNKRCKIVRELKILQVYPSTSTGHTISVKGVLNTLASNEDYSLFRDSIAIENISTNPGTIDYKVDNITISDFNSKNIHEYLPVGDPLQNYNLIVFGFGDIASDDLSTSTKLIVENFIENGGMVIFGSGSITNTYNSKTSDRYFDYFSKYAGISSGYSSDKYFSSVKKNNSEAFSASQLFELPSQFTISSSSPKYKLASNGSSCGAQCAGIACTASSSRLIDWFDYNISNQRSDNTNPISWASSCNRVGLLQIYSKNATINLEEFKVFGNLIYHLSTLVSGDNF